MLFTNVKLITWEQPNRILEGQAVLVEGERIAQIGPQAELIAGHPHVQTFDGGGQFLMPGVICAHTHFYGAFARGMGIPGPAPENFVQILQKLWWPLDKALDEEGVRLSALVCLVDAVRHGTTTLIDHHASPQFIDGSLDVLADAVDRAGLRAVLCYEVTDRNGPEGMKAGIAENVRFVERTRREAVAGGRLRATFGLHAGLTLSDDTLEACRAAAPQGTGFHIHVAESTADEYDSLSRSGLRMVDRLEKHGILGPQSIAVHAVHVDAPEISILAETGTWVTHQPRSNMNNAVGIGDVESMLRAGVRVCLGNDGFSNAMWQEWKTAYLVHKAWRGDPRRMPADLVVQMGVYNNAALAGMFFPEAPLGVLMPGAAADLILVDYHPYTPLTPGNLPWHMIFGFQESMVSMTMVAGRLLMKDRRILVLDEEEVAARAREIAPALWQRYESIAKENLWPI
jgi:putative selenium metabolism protein SsnA